MFNLSCSLRAPERLSVGKVGIKEGGAILSLLGTTPGTAPPVYSVPRVTCHPTFSFSFFFWLSRVLVAASGIFCCSAPALSLRHAGLSLVVACGLQSAWAQ